MHNTPATTHPESLRAHYDRYRARELEFYKEVVSRHHLLRIADEASAAIHDRRQLPFDDLAFDDLALNDEVNAVIARRMAIPPYNVWLRDNGAAPARAVRRRPSAVQLVISQLPEHRSGLPIVMMQPRAADVWEALCAERREVIVIDPDEESRTGIAARAKRSGWQHLVRTESLQFLQRVPRRVAAVLFSPRAFSDYTDAETSDMLRTLKGSTIPGGVHIADGLFLEREALPRTLLRSCYASWRQRAVRGTRDWKFVATHA